MRALTEKVRTVVLLRPSVVIDGQADSIIGLFDDNYLEVKARKQVYLTQPEAEAFFHYLESRDAAVFQQQVQHHLRGLSEVLVLEHLDGDVIEKTCALVSEITAKETGTYAEGTIYCSQGPWECMRDLEFFFPHADAQPRERTLALIKPDGMARSNLYAGQNLEDVVEAEAIAAGLIVVATRNMQLLSTTAELLCKDLKESDPADYTQALSVLQADGGAIALCLEGRGAVNKWLQLCGPSHSGLARDVAPKTLRARWGTDRSRNAVHGSVTCEAADEELKAFFPPGTLQLQRTLCIVKPDAMGSLLDIRSAIDEAGFTVLKETEVVLTPERASEFYRDHCEKPYFGSMVKEACVGPCCVMVLCRLEAVTVLLQVMGPEVVKDARKFRPNSLRALFGRDGQRNAVHGSISARSAGREIRFFFPELGVDPVPGDDEVRDFLFRKSAGASMDLRSLTEVDDPGFAVDPTLQQLLSKGLMALCQVQPKGLKAVRWLSRWLMDNNPNKPPAQQAGASFAPPDRTKRFVEYGVNQDGMPFAVEAPPAPAKQKRVVEVDVSGETEQQRVADLATPPFVVFMAGGPGSGKSSHCMALKEEFNLVHLSMGDMMREEAAADTYLGTEIYKYLSSRTLVPDAITLQLLKKTMLKHQDTNRFLVDGFPRTVEQTRRFEQEIAEVAFVLHLECSADCMRKRVVERSEKVPGRVDDDPATVEKMIKIFEEQTMSVIQYYTPIGKARVVDAERDFDDVYNETKRYFSCRFVYLLGPPGAPVTKVASRLEEKYGYSSIDLLPLLQGYAESGEKDADSVKQALAKGRPVDASVACPLILSEIYRDMALGIQNFVLCNFPQSLKQAQFLEYRVPTSATLPLLLDFMRADAEDLSTPAEGGGEMEVEARTAAFYGEETQAMLRALQGLQRLPCSLAALDTPSSDGAAVPANERLAEACWQAVLEKVIPGVTIVLGPPCSGTDVLAPMLAGLTPNTQAVDCNVLLDRELERKTEAGITMHNMLARGQVVPLSMTLELLKDVVNLTCSNTLVVENCPMYWDQIEYLMREFRVDRVFHIRGTEKAVQGWKEAYLKQQSKGVEGGEDSGREAKAFDEHKDRLGPIVNYFSRLGRLDVLDVSETPKTVKLEKMIEQATMPQFAIITGQSTVVTPAQAQKLADAYGVGPPITSEFLVEWAKTKLKRSVDPTLPEQFFSALKQYADNVNQSLVVLDRYPVTDKDAAAFVSHFGEPMVVVNLTHEDEFLTEEWATVHEGEDAPEDLAERIQAAALVEATMFKEFQQKCPPCAMQVKWAEVKSPDDLNTSINLRLRPKVYVIVAPASPGVDFSGLVAENICTMRREGKRPAKFTVIDCKEMFQRGGHTAAIEYRLHQASFASGSPDAIPTKLWVDLFGEAFSRSANPMGTFLVTNFPTPCAVTSSPTIRDQFDMLTTISAFMGVMHVKLSSGAFEKCLYPDPESATIVAAEFAAYETFEAKVNSATLVQFDKDRSGRVDQVVESKVDDSVTSAQEAAAAAAAEFHEFKEKAEGGH